jgi:hypothetical protein
VLVETGSHGSWQIPLDGIWYASATDPA